MGTDQAQIEARHRERVDDPVLHDARPKIAAREPPDEAERQAERGSGGGPRRPLVEVEQAEDDRLEDDSERRSDGAARAEQALQGVQEESAEQHLLPERGRPPGHRDQIRRDRAYGYCRRTTALSSRGECANATRPNRRCVGYRTEHSHH
jgi:hypothetical protein